MDLGQAFALLLGPLGIVIGWGLAEWSAGRRWRREQSARLQEAKREAYSRFFGAATAAAAADVVAPEALYLAMADLEILASRAVRDAARPLVVVTLRDAVARRDRSGPDAGEAVAATRAAFLEAARTELGIPIE